MREMPLDEYTAAVARHLGREPDERLRAACAIAQEKAQTLEEVWPLIRFLFEPPVDDQKAWAKVMKEGVRGDAGGRRRGPGGGRALRARSRSRRRWRRCWSASRSSPASSTSRSGSRSPAARSPRASSSRWRRWAARRLWSGSDAAAERLRRLTGRMIDARRPSQGYFRLNQTSSSADGWPMAATTQTNSKLSARKFRRRQRRHGSNGSAQRLAAAAALPAAASPKPSRRSSASRS